MVLQIHTDLCKSSCVLWMSTENIVHFRLTLRQRKSTSQKIEARILLKVHCKSKVEYY